MRLSARERTSRRDSIVNTELIATIESATAGGTAHIEKLEGSAAYLTQFMPLSVPMLENPDSETVRYLDQFICRFTKLQDSMARRRSPR